VYIVSEIQAPEGYLLGSAPQTVEVKSGRLTVVEFTNRELPNRDIRQGGPETGALVAGAAFRGEKDGVFIAYVVSGSTGAVVVPRVQPGFYTITETKAPAGYELNDPVRTVEVRAAGEAYYNSAALPGNLVTFGDNPLNSLEIVKLDSITHNPLSGAMFMVTKANGEHIGSYRTDSAGKILIPEIKEGTYIISETAAPQGYILSEAPKSVNVVGGKLVSVEFLNKPLSGIEIVKLDAATRQPLTGAEFTVAKADGTRIGTFKTEADGKVEISGLDEGVYVVGEIYAPDGYQLDELPKNVTVKSGKLATVEFVNKPFSGIEIRKVDALTGEPLSGAQFEIRKQSGGIVTVDPATTDVGGKASMRNMASDFAVGLNNYHKDNVGWSYEAFYAAAGETDKKTDIFRCLETGKLCVPCAGALCEYSEPPLKEKAPRTPKSKPEPSTLLGEIEEAKAVAAARDKERGNAAPNKKRGDREV
jgi:uncharacterized surface anchored protein